MLPTAPTKRKPKSSVIIPQRKQLVLNFIHEYRRMKSGVSPTFLEIAKGIGFSETAEGTAHTYVRELIKEGWLQRIGDGSRMIIPLKPPSAVYCEITDEDLLIIAHRQRNLRILRRL